MLRQTIAFGLLASACQHVPQPEEAPMPASKNTSVLPASVVRFATAGGLAVTLRPRPGRGVVALQAWVRAGSADEAAGEEGLAHLHEHMLFKGTEAFGVGAIDRAVSAVGGEINAWTSFDETVYHLTLPAEHAGVGMTILAEVLRRALFDATELTAELAVVQEEIRIDRDDPGRRLGQRLFAAAYGPSHPYGRDIAASVEQVAGLDQAKLRAFYAKHYHPKNIRLMLTGDLDRVAAEELVSAAFGDWVEPGEAGARSRPEAAGKSGVSVVREPVQETHIALAWARADHDLITRIDADLLATVLGFGESSRLVRDLQYERRLVNGVFSYHFDPLGPGLLVVGGVTDAARVRAATEALIRGVAGLSQHAVSDAELARAQAQLLADAVYQTETVQEEAGRIGHFEVNLGGLAEEAKHRALIRSATPERLLASARKLITAHRQVLVVTLPKGSDPTLDDPTFAAISRGAWAASQSAAAMAADLPQVDAKGRHVLRLPSGVNVVLQPDAERELLAVHAVWLGGQLVEDAGQAGWHTLLAAVMPQASESLGEVEMAERLDGWAASLDAVPGRNSFGLRGACLAENAEPFLDLFLDVLRFPRLEASSVDRERARLLDKLMARDDRPARRAWNLGMESLFGKHPYGQPVEGTDETIRHVRAADLVKLYEEQYKMQAPTIVLVGNFDAARVLGRLLRAFPASTEAINPTVQPASVTYQNPPANGPTVLELPREQVHLVRVYPGLPLGHADEPAMVLLMEILSGASGRLFRELREARGLSYSVSGMALTGTVGGAVTFHLSTQPGREGEATVALDELLSTLASAGPSDEELSRARAYLSGARRLQSQASSDIAQSNALDVLYGLGLDREDQLERAMMNVTGDQVSALAGRLFAADLAHTVLVGPRTPTQEAPSDRPVASKAPMESGLTLRSRRR
jgi:zinc protease